MTHSIPIDSAMSGKQPRLQRTVAGHVEFSGPGLFHGIEAKVRVKPAAADAGIVFRRTDLKGSPDISACIDRVQKVPRRTVLATSDECRVETVEHLMAALAGLHIDNCVVEIDAPEVPAYDGSCLDFCDGILTVGAQELDRPVKLVRVAHATFVQSSELKQSISLRPYLHSHPAITYHLDYGARSPVVPQMLSTEVTPEVFYRDIAGARTFVLESEIAALQKMGYGKHLTAKDIVVFGENGVIDNELRWPDECVRHKILDCVGDLALCGVSYSGHITASRSGHHLNHCLARKITNKNAGAVRRAA